MAQVFISHSSLDREFVESQIVPLLNHHGLETWYAPSQITAKQQWEDEIHNGLKSSDFFVLIISPNALESQWVKAELSFAFEKIPDRIIPVILDECDQSELHIRLPLLQHVDYRENREQAHQKLIAAFQDVTDAAEKLRNDLLADLNHVPLRQRYLAVRTPWQQELDRAYAMYYLIRTELWLAIRVAIGLLGTYLAGLYAWMILFIRPGFDSALLFGLIAFGAFGVLMAALEGWTSHFVKRFKELIPFRLDRGQGADTPTQPSGERVENIISFGCLTVLVLFVLALMNISSVRDVAKQTWHHLRDHGPGTAGTVAAFCYVMIINVGAHLLQNASERNTRARKLIGIRPAITSPGIHALVKWLAPLICYGTLCGLSWFLGGGIAIALMGVFSLSIWLLLTGITNHLILANVEKWRDLGPLPRRAYSRKYSAVAHEYVGRIQ